VEPSIVINPPLVISVCPVNEPKLVEVGKYRLESGQNSVGRVCRIISKSEPLAVMSGNWTVTWLPVLEHTKFTVLDVAPKAIVENVMLALSWIRA
jgi:hypothetical protein